MYLSMSFPFSIPFSYFIGVFFTPSLSATALFIIFLFSCIFYYFDHYFFSLVDSSYFSIIYSLSVLLLPVIIVSYLSLSIFYYLLSVFFVSTFIFIFFSVPPPTFLLQFSFSFYNYSAFTSPFLPLLHFLSLLSCVVQFQVILCLFFASFYISLFFIHRPS